MPRLLLVTALFRFSYTDSSRPILLEFHKRLYIRVKTQAKGGMEQEGLVPVPSRLMRLGHIACLINRLQSRLQFSRFTELYISPLTDAR